MDRFISRGRDSLNNPPKFGGLPSSGPGPKSTAALLDLPPIEPIKDPKHTASPFDDGNTYYTPTALAQDSLSKRDEVPLKLRPSTGRTVYVQGRINVPLAFNMMSALVHQNGVARDHKTQKFHERPGLRRKRLKSSRWRNRFMKGFKAACTRATELAKQGW
jgi:hypothetical protein